MPPGRPVGSKNKIKPLNGQRDLHNGKISANSKDIQKKPNIVAQNNNRTAF